MTAAPAFNVDTPLFLEPKKGSLRKRLNRHLFGFYTLQQVDDDMLLTRLFRATPNVLGQEPPHVKT